MQEIMTAIRRIEEIEKNNPEIGKMINNIPELGFIELIVLKKVEKQSKPEMFSYSPLVKDCIFMEKY
jgi:hypothetical protein